MPLRRRDEAKLIADEMRPPAAGQRTDGRVWDRAAGSRPLTWITEGRRRGSEATRCSVRWDLGAHCRPAADRAVEAKVAAGRLDAIGEPAQPRAPPRSRPADPVVGHLDVRRAVLARDPHADLRGLGVL